MFAVVKVSVLQNDGVVDDVKCLKTFSTYSEAAIYSHKIKVNTMNSVFVVEISPIEGIS
jgi:hypothetical protein